ncbi:MULTISPECIES: VOC family protein [unclassified Sphingomonas]|uniref:VOC family protein n=1 Tax=unclassified Sphingomonas TaxID=196159 RepID=UPI00226ADCBA|nr:MULTISPECIES: VOC family protein [unclassified Sphingomonas]
MANPHGMPIWYELLTRDPAAAKTFYDAVIGWSIKPHPTGGLDYRLIATSDADGARMVGGVMTLDDDMAAHGASPRWLFYVGVDDVDATAELISAEGGTIIMPPWSIPEVGRMALVADPQGIPFYVMRGASDESSTAFDRAGLGQCNWNELSTTDQPAAQHFYARVFGWRYPDRMPMGAMGDYVFVEAAGTTIGATMTAAAEGPPAAWLFYFRAPDIERAAETVTDHCGTVHRGPMTVPGGDRIIVASDPEGVMFGVVGPGELA